MVLPVLGGLLGSALASGGIAGLGAMGISPLMASAIGSGLGQFIETGNARDALTSGVTGYLGGAMLGNTAGKLMGDMKGAAGASGIGTLMQNPEFMKGATGAVVSGLASPQSYSYPGGGGGGGLREEAPAPRRSLSAPGPKPYRSAEYDYRVYPNYGMQDGGMVTDEKDVIQNAVAAIQGRHPNPEIALGLFLKTYGEAALQELIQSVQRGDFEANAGPAEGAVRGPNVGMDMVPALNESNGQDLLLESGEFVFPRDAVKGIGDGNEERGTAALYRLMENARA